LKFQFASYWFLIFSLAVSSCSIDLSQPSANTPSSEVETVPSVVSPTALPQGKPTQQTTNIIPSFPTTTIPITWGALNLSGKLIYTSAVFQGQSILIDIRSLDLTTGIITTIFQTPEGGWVEAVTVSPDRKKLVMSYIPPVGAPSGGQKALYSMLLAGSAFPQLLFTPPSLEDNYSQPEWSPDGKYIYFTHFKNQSAIFDVWRMPYPNGKLEKLADNASWPRVSEDGTYLVYVWIDSGTGVNRLYVANADGSDAHNVRLTGSSAPKIIDAPMFSADGQSIIFSAPNSAQSTVPGLFLMWLDIKWVLKNGSVPSDWWSVPLAGGEPNQLTNVRSLALFGNFSPDKKYIAIHSADGIFVMTPDGGGLTALIDDVGQIFGTVSWIP
jgi:Tol biopolymer transport system component